MLKLIQVGISGMGNAWLDTIPKCPEVKLTGIVDINEKFLSAAGEKTGLGPAAQFKSLPEALKKTECDAVLNVTPPAFHKEICITSAKAGKHVLTEKPLSDKWDDALEMVSAARACRIKMMVSQNYRFSSAARMLRKVLTDKPAGELENVYMTFHKAADFGPDNFRTKMKYPLLLDMSIHHFDLARYFTGQNPMTVYARSFRPEGTVYHCDPGLIAVFELSNKTLFTYQGCWSDHGRQDAWSGTWRFQCCGGSVHFENDIITVAKHGQPEQKIDVVPLEHEGLGGTLNEFINAVKKNREPECSAQDNINSVAMQFFALESIKKDKRVMFSTTKKGVGKNE